MCVLFQQSTLFCHWRHIVRFFYALIQDPSVLYSFMTLFLLFTAWYTVSHCLLSTTPWFSPQPSTTFLGWAPRRRRLSLSLSSINFIFGSVSHMIKDTLYTSSLSSLWNSTIAQKKRLWQDFGDTLCSQWEFSQRCRLKDLYKLFSKFIRKKRFRDKLLPC